MDNDLAAHRGTKMNELTIIIPGMPPRELSPNFHPKGEGIEWVRRRVVKNWRWMVYVQAVDTINKAEKAGAKLDLPWAKASFKLVAHVPDKRSLRDSDNLMASFKAGLDALTLPRKNKVGAGILADDSPDVLTIDPVEWCIDGRRYLEVILRGR